MTDQPTPHSASAYPVPTYSSPSYSGESAPTKPRRNPLGVVALIVAAAAVILGFVMNLVQAGIIATGDYTVIGIITAVQTGINGFLGLAAALLGLIALLIKGAGKAFAAAGFAVGCSILVGVIGALLYSVVIQIVAGM
jgi:hypothetical protein